MTGCWVLLQNIDISRSIDQDTLAILQPASPAVRSHKKEAQMAAAAVLAGLLCGIGDRFADRVAGRSVYISFGNERAASATSSLGRCRNCGVPEARRNGCCCRLRMIDRCMPSRTAICVPLFSSCLLRSSARRIMLVTSAMPNEGKSTIASNLAHTLAMGGSRVVLIDADLRQGQLHELLGMKREPGLVEALEHPEDLDKVIQRNCMPNLSFIPCGRALSRPGDLFVGPALEQLLARLRQQFDHVILDTSPVFASDDVATLAPRADGTLFVVRRGLSRSGPCGRGS